MAALDTTALMIGNTIRLLSLYPDIWKRLRAEVAGAKPDGLTIEDIKKYRLLGNIMKESLRLYGVFPVLARDSLVDTVLPTGGGSKYDQPIFAPAGTRIICDFWTLHRNPDIYGPDAQSFNPDRWDFLQPRSWQYMAFGGGQRVCLGQHKALGEAGCTIIRLAQAFERIENRDDREPAWELQLVAKNINGCKVGFFQA